MLKLTGFIREHDNLSVAHSFNIMFKHHEVFGLSSIDQQLLPAIIAYLEAGVPILSWMNYVMDIATNEPLCPNGYYTDGAWVWPGYYTSYLKKHPDLMVEKRFLDDICEKQFINEAKNNPAIDLVSLEKEFRNKLDELRFE